MAQKNKESGARLPTVASECGPWAVLVVRGPRAHAAVILMLRIPQLSSPGQPFMLDMNVSVATSAVWRTVFLTSLRLSA